MTNSDQKCIYRYADVFAGGKISVCGQTVDGINHRDVLGDGQAHDFQPPFEITDEAVTAFGMSWFGKMAHRTIPFSDAEKAQIRTALEAALSVMQKGQDK